VLQPRTRKNRGRFFYHYDTMSMMRLSVSIRSSLIENWSILNGVYNTTWSTSTFRFNINVEISTRIFFEGLGMINFFGDEIRCGCWWWWCGDEKKMMTMVVVVVVMYYFSKLWWSCILFSWLCSFIFMDFFFTKLVNMIWSSYEIEKNESNIRWRKESKSMCLWFTIRYKVKCY